MTYGGSIGHVTDDVEVALKTSKVGVCKIGDLRTLSRHISETVQDMTKVAIDH